MTRCTRSAAVANLLWLCATISATAIAQDGGVSSIHADTPPSEALVQGDDAFSEVEQDDTQLSPTLWDRIIDGELYGNFGAEFRIFPRKPLSSAQPKHFNASLAFEPGYRLSLSDDVTLDVIGFLRVDQNDGRRTHWDLREAYLQALLGPWSLGLGVHKVFWGVTESRHLVDILNQSDFVENINGEDKLGQAMVSLSYTHDAAGVFDFYVMSWFRPIVFPGTGGRPRLPLPVLNSEATYESSLKRGHPDVAFRWSKSQGEFDWGLSYFYGTSREPELMPATIDMELPLAPNFALIHQGGVELQWTHEAWLWKLESIVRGGQGDPFFAVSAGFEYTFYGLFESDVDLGLLAEYNYDGRDNTTFTIFQNDAFGGFRFAFNDTSSTDLLVGALVDTETGAVLITAEASRRLGSSWKLILEGGAFLGTNSDDPLDFFRRDHFAEIEIQYHY